MPFSYEADGRFGEDVPGAVPNRRILPSNVPNRLFLPPGRAHVAENDGRERFPARRAPALGSRRAYP